MGRVSTPGTRPRGYVRLRRAATHDLQVFDAADQTKLLDVMRELAIPTNEDDPDEGSWTPSESWVPHERGHLVYYYRRGLTKQTRRELDEATARGDDLDSETVGANLWDYVIVYRGTTSGECIRHHCPKGITVERLWPVTKLLTRLKSEDFLGT